ncbi:MAG TPA: ABC transporter substrate-binding protein [Acidimicrobiales bacterium]|nr:ABC transporter substrate-binding protein [Acidimicrobiales bacterium]
MGRRRWNPFRMTVRALRRFGRRSRGMQVRTIGLTVAVVAGLLTYVALAPANANGGSGLGGFAIASASASSTPAGVTPPDKASTSSRGVSAHEINVVFPVSNLTSLSSEIGFAGDVEFGEQVKAINFFVGLINKKGGINGRKINAIIANFDPTSETDMRSLCKQWTEGSPPVFAVLDGIGAWTGDNQLCITQEGHTPFIGDWTTVTNWTTLGSPYLWWTGPDQAAILKTLVVWALSTGAIGAGKTLGIVAGDRASDQLALKDYLIPDLQNVGVTPVVETLASDPSDTATTNAEAPVDVQKLRAAGVTSLIPLVPFNAWLPLIQAQTQQKFFPKELLSDYEGTITGGLGLLPTFDPALNGQEGISTLTLGGFDDNRPEAQGGYDPGLRACYNDWHKAYPKPVGTSTSFYIEEQGPIAAWCGAVRLFATAAKMAGPNLNRRTFVEAMSRIKNYPGTWEPTWSFGPDKFYGPTDYQVVVLHDNSPPSPLCVLKTNGQPQGTCWHTIERFRPLITGGG